MRKNLCICQFGHSRSVAMARYLHLKGESAVAAGVGTSGDAITPLSEWADRIFIMQPAFLSAVPQEQRHKVVLMDVGPDKWSNPYSQDLASVIDTMYLTQKL